MLTGTLERISSLNRYAYVEGNPVSFLDPFGLAKSIYDEWHEKLNEAMIQYSRVSTIVSWLDRLPKKVKEKLNLGDIIVTIGLYSMDIGVCIGRAWEGVFENDYEKVDTSYQMMGEVLENFILAISSLILDNVFDFKVSGKILHLVSELKRYSESLMKGE